MITANALAELAKEVTRTAGPASVADAIGDYEERARVRNEFFAAARAYRLALWENRDLLVAALALAEATSEKYRAYEERSNEAMRNVAGGGVKDFGLREWDNAVADACMAEDRALSAFRSAQVSK